MLQLKIWLWIMVKQQRQQESDSTVATTEKSYFTSADGLLKINTDGHVGYYLFNEKGYLMTGRVTREPGVDGYTGTKKVEWYLLEKDKATLYAGCEDQAITPWTSNLGQQPEKILAVDRNNFPLLQFSRQLYDGRRM